MSLSVEDFCKPLPNIALFGKTRAGKDEVYKILKFMGFNVERVAFGDVMKEKFYELFPHLPKEPKPIKEQQLFNVLTKIDSEVWVRPTFNRMEMRKNLLKQAELEIPSFIVTDMRQPHEYEACKRAGFIMVKVEAPEEIRVQRMLELGENVSREVLDAPTEVALDQFEYDYLLKNGGSNYDFEMEVVGMIYKIQSKRGN